MVRVVFVSVKACFQTPTIVQALNDMAKRLQVSYVDAISSVAFLICYLERVRDWYQALDFCALRIKSPCISVPY